MHVLHRLPLGKACARLTLASAVPQWFRRANSLCSFDTVNRPRQDFVELHKIAQRLQTCSHSLQMDHSPFRTTFSTGGETVAINAVTVYPALAQLAVLVLLWAAFLITQMVKARYGRCTWQFASIFVFQTVMLAVVTLAALHYESYKFKVSTTDWSS